MLTGEGTVAPFAGVQMVTDGLAVFKVQGADCARTETPLMNKQNSAEICTTPRENELVIGLNLVLRANKEHTEFQS
jgi:hypothetical protein